MDFVDISAGAIADDTGYGAVANDYRMGVNEVSRAMIDSYNALSVGPALSMSDMASLGGNGANRPATGINWNEAARFANWMNTSNGYAAAYKFTTGGANDNLTLWTVGDVGYDSGNPFRNRFAVYFLPSENEWYRAAYFDPDSAVYWDYATGSNTAPTSVSDGTATGTAVYEHSTSHGPADITNAGGLSPFGTMAQSGNVYELIESGLLAPNDSAGETRLSRGGVWNTTSTGLQSSSLTRSGVLTTDEGNSRGFRIAALPEPLVIVPGYSVELVATGAVAAAGITVGSDGFVYVADFNGGGGGNLLRVPVAMTNGSFETIASGLANPGDVTRTPDGRLFVTESAGGRITEVFLDGSSAVLASNFTNVGILLGAIFSEYYRL